MRKLTVVVDLQFGSTGKGLLCGALAKNDKPDVIVTAWAPNAGHTFVDKDDNKYVNISMPSGIIAGPGHILIGPGSVINPTQFLMELERYRALGFSGLVCVHPHAACVYEHHRATEAMYGFKIGSTMKGVGEAVIQKIRRMPNDMNLAASDSNLQDYIVDEYYYNDVLDRADHVFVEGAQGYSLSINHGMYPYTTSRDCTYQQLMVDCAIPRFNHKDVEQEVWGVCRTLPIRVANRFNTDGEQIGTSGPGYPDQEELRWEDLGLEPELTTVTKLPRRIFSFSELQVREAIRMNGVNNVFINFCNYVSDAETRRIADTIESCRGNPKVCVLGYGPRESDLVWPPHIG